MLEMLLQLLKATIQRNALQYDQLPLILHHQQVVLLK
jgi:hypothetical protein